MVFELYLRSPAFGLPSIDAECNATYAYLLKTLPPDSWTLRTSTSAPGSRNLPTLYDPNSSTWTSGFNPIISYLSATSDTQSSSYTGLSDADNYALAVHLSTTLRPLIDYQLFANRTHYTHFTRPAWASKLSFPWNYTMLSAWHDLAVQRASRAGLSGSSPSLETHSHDQTRADLSTAEASITSSSPSLLFGSSRLRTLRTLAQEHSALRFRIEALVNDALKPLDDAINARGEGASRVLGGHSNSWTRVTCVVVGYLSLLLQFPGPVLKDQEQYVDTAIAEHIRSRWPRIVHWYEESHEQTLAYWDSFETRSSDPPTLSDRFRCIADYAIECAVPYHKRQLLKHTWPISSLPALLMLLGAMVPIGWAIFRLVAAKGQRETVFLKPLSSHGLRGMGEAGAMLGVLAGLGSVGRDSNLGTEGSLGPFEATTDGAPIAEASVEVSR